MGFKKGNVAWNKGFTGWNKGHLVSEETRTKIGNANRGEKNGMYGKTSPRRGKIHTVEAKEKNKQSHLGKKYNLSDEVRQKKREQALKNLPAMYTSNKHYDSIERNRKISESKKLQWQNLEWKEKVLKKIFESNGVKPNKLELYFQDFLNQNFPGDWKYVGDGEIWIAGKCPDFWNMNGKKQIIELFGSYFHKPEDEEIRKSHFAKYGYKTLVVWDYELKNQDEVVSKIQNFV